MLGVPWRIASLLAIAAAAVALAAWGGRGLRRAVGVVTGFVSHQLCSGVFISGLDGDEYYRRAIAPAIGPVAFLIHQRIDREHAEVRASFAGLFETRAVYRGTEGCLVLHGAPPPPVTSTAAEAVASRLPPIAGPEIVESSDPALAMALDRAFAEPTDPPHRWTKAVVIVHDGQVVAERYAPGYHVDTPVIGFSMTKSVVNALIGVLVRERKLAVDDPAPVAAWSDPRDPRRSITVDNLLRMTSGLDIGQSLIADAASLFDPSSQMEFDERDMAAFAERAHLGAAPGQVWTYTNGNTLLLSRIIRDQAGGDAAAVLRFARRELFDKLGMQRVTLEFDAVGTPIGSTYMYATARDWARFGLLYLEDGTAGGERILPVGWVEYSARLTPGSEAYGYGAGFWTNRGDSRAARARVSAGMTDDSFMAVGVYGQFVVVAPSARMVIVRLGASYTPRGDFEAMIRLAADARAAVKLR